MTPLQTAIKLTVGLAAPTFLALAVDYWLRRGTRSEQDVTEPRISMPTPSRAQATLSDQDVTVPPSNEARR